MRPNVATFVEAILAGHTAADAYRMSHNAEGLTPRIVSKRAQKLRQTRAVALALGNHPQGAPQNAPRAPLAPPEAPQDGRERFLALAERAEARGQMAAAVSALREALKIEAAETRLVDPVEEILEKYPGHTLRFVNPEGRVVRTEPGGFVIDAPQHFWSPPDVQGLHVVVQGDEW